MFLARAQVNQRSFDFSFCELTAFLIRKQDGLSHSGRLVNLILILCVKKVHTSNDFDCREAVTHALKMLFIHACVFGETVSVVILQKYLGIDQPKKFIKI